MFVYKPTLLQDKWSQVKCGREIPRLRALAISPRQDQQPVAKPENGARHWESLDVVGNTVDHGPVRMIDIVSATIRDIFSWSIVIHGYSDMDMHTDELRHLYILYHICLIYIYIFWGSLPIWPRSTVMDCSWKAASGTGQSSRLSCLKILNRYIYMTQLQYCLYYPLLRFLDPKVFFLCLFLSVDIQSHVLLNEWTEESFLWFWGLMSHRLQASQQYWIKN